MSHSGSVNVDVDSVGTDINYVPNDSRGVDSPDSSYHHEQQPPPYLSYASVDDSRGDNSLDDSYHHEHQGWEDKGEFDHDYEHHDEFHGEQ